MSALSSVYVSLTSLLSFSKALDVIGDNVANLNTTGFKGSDLLFFDIPDDRGGRQDMPSDDGGRAGGFGTTVAVGGRRFLAGEIRETGTASHLAIRGQGFFVLNTPDGLLYTRAGQLDLDESGRLTDPNTGGVLQALQSGGGLSDLIVNVNGTSPAQPTTTIAFTGNLSTGSTTHSINQIDYFDADGTQRRIALNFTQNTAAAGSWTVEVRDDQGVEILEGEIRFQGAGFPSPGFNTLSLNIVAGSGANSLVTLNFGTPGSLDGATSLSGGTTSTLTGEAEDGFGLGRLTNFQFDAQGRLNLSYSNGQTETGAQVALASFPDPRVLDTTDGVYFRSARTDVELGVAGQGGLGSIAPRSLELANIELAREFADIIILQRGYQASSQVMNVSSQLIEDVYNSMSGRG